MESEPDDRAVTERHAGRAVAKVLDSLPISRADLARQMGQAPSTISGYLTRANITVGTLHDIADALNELCSRRANGERFTAASLVEGRAEEGITRGREDLLMWLAGGTQSDLAKVFMPFYGVVPSPVALSVDGQPTNLANLGDVTNGAYKAGECFLLQAFDESMAPMVRTGDWLVVNHNLPIQLQQVGCFVVNGDSTLMRRYATDRETGRNVLQPENPEYETLTIAELSERPECLGVLTAVVRSVPVA